MSSRYYDSCVAEGEIKPGKISAELREALNIAENDIPLWIYRMRALGYPPGWLKKAVVDTSDIFDTDLPSNEDTDSSDISRKRKNPDRDEVQYDHSKLIEYPGFNSPMPKDCVDYHYYINMPAMLEHQQLEYAKKHMNAFKPIQLPKRTRYTNESTNYLNESNASTITIDLTEDSNDSVSLIENTNNACVENEKDKETEKEKETDNSLLSSSSSPTPKEIPKSISLPSLPEEIKLVSKGSPMPKPVERAPLEKFSEGVVGELLYFENLPASTGKFDSIRGLLNTIRRPRKDNDTSFGSTKSLK